jgi:hypothetical protein
MSWRGIANLDAKIFVVPLEGTTSKLGPIVGDDHVWDPESTYDGLDELHCGLLVDFDHWVASGHLVNLSMVTYMNRYPPTARENGPTMFSPHTVKGHEGGIIYSICADVWICLAWN